MIGVPPNLIDIMMGIPGVDFDQAWEQRVEADLEGVTVNYILRKKS